MNNIEEVIQAIAVGLVVATFLLKTGRCLNAIELCKECLILVKSKAYGKQERIVHQFYDAIYNTTFEACCRIQDYTNAIQYGRKLLVLYRHSGEVADEGYFSIRLAKICQRQDKFFEANELYERAINCMKQTGDRGGAAGAYGHFGTMLNSFGRYALAKECIEKSLAIRIEINDKEGEAVDCGNLGAVLLSLGDNFKAKEYLQRALAIRKKIGDRDGEAADYGNLGAVFLSLKEYVKAK